MGNIIVLDRPQFDMVISQLNNAKDLDVDCLYEIYSVSSEAMQNLLDSNIIPAFRNVNPRHLLLCR